MKHILRKKMSSSPILVRSKQTFASKNKMTSIPSEEIPTVSLLYRFKKLVPADKYPDDKVPVASQSFNDRVGVIRGDITKLQVDAIVNAANNSLLGGGGVDGAIHRAAGKKLLKECYELNGCETGSAKITGGYDLPSKRVIHAVGPIYDSRDHEESEEKLRSCYTTALKLAVENDCKTIAFSALSTGVYGYPSNAAAPVAIKAVKDFLEGADGDKLEKVVFTTFVQKDVDAYDRWLPWVCFFLCLVHSLTYLRRFFPPTEPVTEQVKDEMPAADENARGEDDWEEVQAGESAENGVVTDSQDASEQQAGGNEAGELGGPRTEGTKGTDSPEVVLPDVPTSEQVGEGPSPKRQKGNEE